MNKKIINEVKNDRGLKIAKPVINFEGGISYKINPLDTLKMVSASSIFGEPQYYREGVTDSTVYVNDIFKEHSIFQIDDIEKTSQYMERIIDASLDYDFKGTILWAKELRQEYYIRLNPQIIMVRAAIHPKRVEFSEEYPNLFAEIENNVMLRGDEPASQFTYYLYLKKDKNNLPNILKRAWKRKIESLSRYEVNKYKNSDIGLIDTIRVSHANNEIINELMKNGKVEVKEEDKTWEQLRSSGLSWKEILLQIDLPYMATLRNLVGIFKEIDDRELLNKVLTKLKNGVLKSKQFPFRYYSALMQVKRNSDINFQIEIMDCLNECMDTSLDNMPKLKGRTIALSDISGSTSDTFNSSYGSVRIYEIDNLSSVIIAKNSDEGYVGRFNENLSIIPISKRNGVLTQTELLNGKGCGGGTENPLYLLLTQAIDKKEHWDNIFIFSDMQQGHERLCGYWSNNDCKEWLDKYNLNSDETWKLVDLYRKMVNPKVNIFSVQTAGYNNSVLPEYGYRTNLLFGWTGKELIFADTIIKQWDILDEKYK